MYIVVIGLGEVGRYLLAVLDREGHDVVAVDASPEAVQYAEDHFDVATLVGYGASQETLDGAGVAKSDLVVAVTDHDEVNLIAALAAKQLGARRVIARAQGNEWAQWTEGVRYGLLGVDVVINPRVLVAQEFAKIARSHGASHVVDLAQDRVELVQVEMTSSRLTKKPLSKIDLPAQTLIAAVVRNGELFIPGGADILLEGDTVYLIGRPRDVMKAEDLFTEAREARRVCIVGGGVVGHSLANELCHKDVEVLIIEQSRAVAEELAVKQPQITVAHGDGTDRTLLEELEIESYDLFIAVTREDEVNLMAALIATRVGVDRVAVLVHRADHIPIYRELGIDIALSPRSVASDHILRFARGGQLHSLSMLEDGQAEVVELTAAHGCRAVGTPLRRMNLPRGALLASVVHVDGKVTIPRGDDIVQAGERVILVVTEGARPTVEGLFRSGRS